jgi:hypothetical protein
MHTLQYVEWFDAEEEEEEVEEVLGGGGKYIDNAMLYPTPSFRARRHPMPSMASSKQAA